jgi:hypothetical protein
MQAVRSLCSRGLLLSRGRVVVDASVINVADTYLAALRRTHQTCWSSTAGLGDEDVLLKAMRIYSSKEAASFFTSERIFVELIVSVLRSQSGLCVGFDLLADDGTVVLRAFDVDDAQQADEIRNGGTYRIVCTIPPGLLHGRRCGIAPRIGIHYVKWIVTGDPLIFADFTLDHGQSPYWTFLDSSNRPGLIAPVLDWQSEPLGGLRFTTEPAS